MANNPFEILISNFLIPDSNIIKESTIQLKEALKNPECINQLVQLIATCQNPMVRQYACVLLRNKITKRQQWKSLTADQQNLIQETLQKALYQETENYVVSMVCSAFAVLAKHRLDAGPWPQFFPTMAAAMAERAFTQTYEQQNGGSVSMATPTVQFKELLRTCFILSELLTHPGLAMHFVFRHMGDFTAVFRNVLQRAAQSADSQNQLIEYMPSYYVAKSLIQLLPSLEENTREVEKWGDAILILIGKLIPLDEDKSSELMEFFTDAIECDCFPSLKTLEKYISTFLQMIPNPDLPDTIKIKAVYFIRAIVVNKKKIFHKPHNNKLIEAVINMIIPIFGTRNEDDLDDSEFYEEESYQCSLLGSVIDLLEEIGLNISPSKFVPTLLKHCERMMSSGDPYQHRGAFLALAAIVEGCPTYIKQKYLNPLLTCVMNGINLNGQNLSCLLGNAPSPQKYDHIGILVVNKAAFHALSHFAESLQPEIMNFHAQILPVLYERVGTLTTEFLTKNSKLNSCSNADMGNICDDTADDTQLDHCLIKAFTAFETFIENMDKEILEPYLPTILKALTDILKNDSSPQMSNNKLKEFAISALAATASAAEESIQPYFNELITLLERYLTVAQNTPSNYSASETRSPDLAKKDGSSSNEKLRIQCIDALNMFARCLKRASPALDSFVTKCLEYVAHILNSDLAKDNPDLKSVSYGLIGGLSAIAKEKVALYLPQLIPHFTASLSSNTELMSTTKDGQDNEKSALLRIFDSVSTLTAVEQKNQLASQNGGAHGADEIADDDDEDDNDNIEDENDSDDFAVENAYIEEKENALLHLGELASNLGILFIPYLEQLYTQILPMMSHTYIDVQIEAIKCLANMCECLATSSTSSVRSQNQLSGLKTAADFSTINQLTGEPTSDGSSKIIDTTSSGYFAFNLMAHECLTRMIEIIRSDLNTDVVCATFEAINQILKTGVITADHGASAVLLEPILTLVKRGIRKKLKCQLSDDDTDDVEHQNGEMETAVNPVISRKGKRLNADGQNGGADDDEDGTEADELLVQTSWECVCALVSCFTPARFGERKTADGGLSYFMDLLQKKLMVVPGTGDHTSGDSTTIDESGERLVLVGVLAELISIMTPDQLWPDRPSTIDMCFAMLYHVINPAVLDGNSKEENDTTELEILSNALFGLGWLVLNNAQQLILDQNKWTMIKFKLDLLVKAFESRKAQQNKFSNSQLIAVSSADECMLQDNITAALARFITAVNYNLKNGAIPNNNVESLQQDITKFLSYVLMNAPLKRDMSECVTIYYMLSYIWQSGYNWTETELQQLTHMVVKSILACQNIPDDPKAEYWLKHLFTQLCAVPHCQTLFQSPAVIGSLTADQKEYLNSWM